MSQDIERTTHTPVLLHEVIELLAVQPDDVIVDCTAGGGGHAEALIRYLGTDGRYIALDADAAALSRVKQRIGEDTRVTYIEGNFRDVGALLETHDVRAVDKCLLDLGLSSDQVDVAQGRGFSFKLDEPLIMTYAQSAPEGTLTAWHVVNEWSEEHIADILYGFGGERRSRKIARAICTAREDMPIDSTQALADVVQKAVGQRGALHPATRTFQAIRIAVNDELGALEAALSNAHDLLSPGGRVAVITFHSLEDRVVKRTFRAWQHEGYGTILTKHPTVPTRDERKNNRRARSAKLRGFMKSTAA